MSATPVTAYFWQGERVKEFHGIPFTDAVSKAGLTELLCVDTLASEAAQRFGKFSISEGGWVHVPKEQFPKEFLTQLLLLGIPIKD